MEAKIQNFPAVLEKIVFNKEELAELKDFITKFSTGEIDTTQLKQYILQTRIRIINDLTEFFPFYVEKMKIKEESLKNIKKNKGADGDISRLLEQIKERDDLLNNLIPRILNLEKKISLSSPMPSSNIPSVEMKIEDIINRALKTINIEHWLLAFLTNEDGSIIRNDYQFFQQFITTIEKYHDEILNLPYTHDTTNVERIENLILPDRFKDELIRILSVRNNLSHHFYKLCSDDVEHVYETYFDLIIYLITQALPKEMIEKSKQQIKHYLVDFIKQKINNETFIASIAYKLITTTFN
jgi:hypothetical protein